MDERARRIRQQVARVERAARGGLRRYPGSVRQEVTEYTRARRETGESLAVVAGRLGIPVPTLAVWLREEKSVRFRPVRVSEAGPGGPVVTLTTPGGYRVEGLGLAELAALLRALQ